MLEPKAVIVNRKDLLRVLLGDAQPASDAPMNMLASLRLVDNESVALLYEPGEISAGMPAAIILPRTDEQEFFAWFSTYAPQFSPITQFSRVLRSDQLRLFSERSQIHHLRERRHAWAGLVMGECLALQAAEQVIELEKLSLTAAQSTYSFAIAKSDCIWSRDDVRRLVENALREMQTTGTLGARPILWSDLSLAWGLVSEVVSRVQKRELMTTAASATLRRALDDLAASSSISVDTIFEIRTECRPAELLLEMTEKTAEERVALFDLLLREFREHKLDDSAYRLAAFVVAYAALRIGGGSTQHADLLKPLRGDHPLVWLWYGLIASLGPSIQWDRRFARTARLIERELRYDLDLLQPPHSDISWIELKTMISSGGTDFLRSLPRAQTRSISIEMFPGVAVPVPIGSRNEKVSEGEPRSDVSTALLARLDSALAELWSIRNTLKPNSVGQSKPSEPEPAKTQPRKSRRRQPRLADDTPPGTTKKLL